MDTHNFARFSELLQSLDLQAALLTNPATIAWLTGYAPPIQTGPNPFEGGPALGWWQAGELVLILSDAEASSASILGINTQEYLSYSIEEPIQGVKHQAAALRTVLDATASLKGKVGVEMNFLLANYKEVLAEALPFVQFQSLDGAFDRIRAVKSPEEVEKIRESLRLCDLAQSFVASHIKPGMSEIEAWGALKARLEQEAGARLPILADFVAGQRTAEIGGLPGEYILRSGDPLIADIVPRLNGYWGDNAGTHFLGTPSLELEKMYRVVRATLQAGIEKIRPGVLASELDRTLRMQIVAEGFPVYPHHSGHGLGTTFHEEPRIVPYNDLQLQPGMVIAIEPGIYIHEVGGVRLEDVVLVTQDGCELLTDHLSAK
jgi:Xaa-Pro dipeptidase